MCVCDEKKRMRAQAILFAQTFVKKVCQFSVNICILTCVQLEKFAKNIISLVCITACRKKKLFASFLAKIADYEN